MTAGRYESCARQSEFSEAKLLRDEFCSRWWVAESHAWDRDSNGRIWVGRKRGVYPPGGMIRCAACRRWTPPDWGGNLCVDCQADLDYEAFFKRLRHWCKCDWPIFFALHWRRPVWLPAWIEERMPISTAARSDYAARPLHEDEQQDRARTKEERDRDRIVGGSLIDEADLFNGDLEPDQRWGPTGTDQRGAVRQLRKSFREVYRNKKGKRKWRVKRRGAGCTKAMLPESDGALRCEILYYKLTDKIRASARRLNNPFNKREDPIPMPGEDGVRWW